jgi:uncharacterized protein
MSIEHLSAAGTGALVAYTAGGGQDGSKPEKQRTGLRARAAARGRPAMSGAKHTATALALIAVALTGCADTSTDTDDVGLSNPASEHCVDQGGRLDIREHTEGDQYGVCVFDDGSERDEWAFYRDECG